MQRKIPMRMCIGCREKRPKKELVRVVRDAEGKVRMDPTGKASGRGAYLCPGSDACLQRAVKSRALERNLEVPIDAELYAQLRQQLEQARHGDD